ncbi:MAG TPA: hypothetical protein DCE44_06080 [Verrucomicrobiales bacterium]|nr:hypothetical protein [Verrucomicrobiales bacterium]
MKRTDREKDWPFATSLGLKLLAEGDLRGWLHIFDAESLTAAFERVPCPPDLIASRPALGLLVSGDPRLDVAIRGEVEFWHQLDKLRMSVHRRAVRSYMVAVGRHPDGDSLELAVQHRVRVAVAERLLPQAPLLDYGIERIIAEAISHASRLVPTGALDWLPDARKNFYGLSQ